MPRKMVQQFMKELVTCMDVISEVVSDRVCVEKRSVIERILYLHCSYSRRCDVFPCAKDDGHSSLIYLPNASSPIFRIFSSTACALLYDVSDFNNHIGPGKGSRCVRNLRRLTDCPRIERYYDRNSMLC